MTRKQISSGTPWESTVGYSRAVRVGDHVYVSGTSPSDVYGTTVAIGDAYGQAKFILQKIAAALAEVDANLTDVVRTRMFVTDITMWKQIGRAHAESFGSVRPAATLVEVSQLIDPDHLVEIEVDAVVSRD